MFSFITADMLNLTDESMRPYPPTAQPQPQPQTAVANVGALGVAALQPLTNVSIAPLTGRLVPLTRPAGGTAQKTAGAGAATTGSSLSNDATLALAGTGDSTFNFSSMDYLRDELEANPFTPLYSPNSKFRGDNQTPPSRVRSGRQSAAADSAAGAAPPLSGETNPSFALNNTTALVKTLSPTTATEPSQPSKDSS